jgi:hypothetical protein
VKSLSSILKFKGMEAQRKIIAIIFSITSFGAKISGAE